MRAPALFEKASAHSTRAPPIDHGASRESHSGAQAGIQLGQRLEREAALRQAGVRDDQLQLGILNAVPVEGEDVQVDQPRASG